MFEREIAALTRHQHGLVTTSQLDDLGLSRRQQLDLVATGEMERDHRGVLRLAGAPVTRQQRVMAATLCLPGSFASHLTAAEVDRFERTPRSGGVTITGGLHAYHDPRGVTVRRSNFIPAHHVTEISGIPVSTAERTIFDLAADLSDRVLGRSIEQQYVDRRITSIRMDRMVREMARPGRRGLARICRVLASIDGNPPPESELEFRFVELVAANGLPAPVLQMALPWADPEVGRVDAAWPAARVIVELDGRRYHALAAAFERDRRRDQLATAAGWRPVRFTWRQVVDAPADVVSILQAILT